MSVRKLLDLSGRTALITGGSRGLIALLKGENFGKQLVRLA